MKYYQITILVTALALGACQQKAATPATAAADTAPPATVNGAPISRELYEFYIKNISGGKKPSDLSKEQRDAALDTLVRAYVVAQQADKDGTTKEADVTDMIELQRLNLLQQSEMNKLLKDRRPTEQELRAEYETEIASLPHLEYHARNIVVATEGYAKNLIDQLERGAKFEDLAKRDSMDSTKDSGGDLGWITPTTSPAKSFADALVALKPGEYTHQPVQTQYGWHVIQLVETRDLQPPTFDSVRQRLEQIVDNKKFKAYMDDLMKTAKVTKSP